MSAAPVSLVESSIVSFRCCHAGFPSPRIPFPMAAPIAPDAAPSQKFPPCSSALMPLSKLSDRLDTNRSEKLPLRTSVLSKVTPKLKPPEIAPVRAPNPTSPPVTAALTAPAVAPPATAPVTPPTAPPIPPNTPVTAPVIAPIPMLPPVAAALAAPSAAPTTTPTIIAVISSWPLGSTNFSGLLLT